MGDVLSISQSVLPCFLNYAVRSLYFKPGNWYQNLIKNLIIDWKDQNGIHFSVNSLFPNYRPTDKFKNGI